MRDSQEILEFYRSGSSLLDLSESFNYTVYQLKKLLAREPEFAAKGYIYRELPNDNKNSTNIQPNLPL